MGTKLQTLAVLAALTANAARPDPAAGDIMIREVAVGGTTHRVALRVPDDYDSSRAWPLIVFCTARASAASTASGRRRSVWGRRWWRGPIAGPAWC